MKKILLAAVIASSIFVAPAAFAATSVKKSSEAKVTLETKLLADLKKKYPSTTFTSVSKAPIGNLYEVIMGRNVAYVDSKADLLLFGHIFDMKTQQDLTQARVDAVNVIDFAKLPLDKSIKVVKGDGSRVFAVFSDPDCPFCHALESTMDQLDNYTMYVFLNPIDQLHPSARERANEIWCSDKPEIAWHDYMTGKNTLKPAKDGCHAPLDDIAQVAQLVGVQGTPMMIRKDGKLAPGALPAASMESFLKADSAVSRAVSINK